MLFTYPQSEKNATFRIRSTVIQNVHVTNLDLSYNNFAGRGCAALAESLEKNTTIRELSLRGNNVGDFGAQALALTIAKNGKLTKLDVSDNGIGEIGGVRLGELIHAKQLKQAVRAHLPMRIVTVNKQRDRAYRTSHGIL